MTEANFYAGSVLDRVSQRRKDRDWIDGLLAHPESRFIATWRTSNLVHIAPDATPQAAFLALGQLGALDCEKVLLGILDGRAYFAVDLSACAAPLAEIAANVPLEFTDLRRVGALLGRQEGSLLAYARGLAYWHERHRFCGVCGSATRSDEAGHVRRCTDAACDASHFPRTDPAVIMLVHDGDRCLLGRKQGWPGAMHSTLAGFVEPGESLEEAVAREVLEETSVRVDEVRYHSSQPWPFPASLMLGFYARARSHDIVIDPVELEHAAWFERSYLLERQESGPRLPRGDSIARRLVDDWLKR